MKKSSETEALEKKKFNCINKVDCSFEEALCRQTRRIVNKTKS